MESAGFRAGTEWRQGLRQALLYLGPLLAVVFLWHVRLILIPFILAGLLAYLLAPPVTFFEKGIGMERIWAILYVYTLGALVAMGCVLFLLPPVLSELQELMESVPAYAAAAQDWVHRVQQDYHRIALPESLRQALDESIAGVEARFVAGLQQLTGGLFVLASGAVHLILAPVLAFYLLADLERLRRWYERLLPARFRGRILRVTDQLDRVLGGFIRGTALVGAIVGALTAAVLYMLGVPYALLLGLFAGAMELIPYFGPILGAAPAIVVALLHAPEVLLHVLVAFIIIQQLESGLISPKVIGSQLGLHPVLVVFSLLVGGHLFGFWGLVLAAPVAGALHVLGAFALRELAARPRYGRSLRDPPGFDTGEAEG